MMAFDEVQFGLCLREEFLMLCLLGKAAGRVLCWKKRLCVFCEFGESLWHRTSESIEIGDGNASRSIGWINDGSV